MFFSRAKVSADEAVAYAQRGRGERKRPASGWDSLTPTVLVGTNPLANFRPLVYN